MFIIYITYILLIQKKLYREVRANETQGKLLKAIIRNIGSMPAAPKVESKEQPIRIGHRKYSAKKITQTKRSISIDARPTHLKTRERDSSLDAVTCRLSKELPCKSKEVKAERIQEGNFLFLSRVGIFI